MNILVVDDEDRIRENFIKRLSRLPISFNRFYQAKDGIEALSIIKNNHIDIALVDINMPFLNGLELIKRLHHEQQKLSIIIISGYDNFSYAQEAIKYGVKGYLLKPVNRLEFEETITSIYQVINDKQTQPIADKLSDIISQELKDPRFNLSDLANKMALSNGHLSKLIIRETSYSFGELLTTLRIKQAQSLLSELPYGTKIYEIAEMVGFNNQHYFSAVFKKETGLTPKEFRKQCLI